MSLCSILFCPLNEEQKMYCMGGLISTFYVPLLLMDSQDFTRLFIFSALGFRSILYQYFNLIIFSRLFFLKHINTTIIFYQSAFEQYSSRAKAHASVSHAYGNRSDEFSYRYRNQSVTNFKS